MSNWPRCFSICSSVSSRKVSKKFTSYEIVYHGRLAKFLKTNSYIPTIIRAVDFVAYGILQIRLLFRLRIVSHWVFNGHSEPAHHQLDA